MRYNPQPTYEIRGRLPHRTEGHDPRSNWIPNSKVAAFITLFDAVAKGLGTDNAAHAYIGIADGTIRKAREQNLLTPEMARRILKGYRSWKAKQQ